VRVSPYVSRVNENLSGRFLLDVIGAASRQLGVEPDLAKVDLLYSSHVLGNGLGRGLFEIVESNMEATKYLAVGPGYWAVHEEADYALLYLLAMMPSLSDLTKKHHVQIFHVSDDWRFDGFSVNATKVESYPMMKIDGRLQNKVRSVFNQVQDVWEKCAIEHDRETDK
jgi:hypothetical protein